MCLLVQKEEKYPQKYVSVYIYLVVLCTTLEQCCIYDIKEVRTHSCDQGLCGFIT